VAISVVQISPVDPSLANFPNAASMAEYRIFGTTYVLDTVAQVVYQFTPGSGVLNNTGGSYTQFQAFLTANPVTSTEAPPSTSSATTAQTGVGLLFTAPPLTYTGLSTTVQQTTTGDNAIAGLLGRIIQLLEGQLLAQITTAQLVAPPNAAVFDSDFAPNPNTGTFQ
jgi:hypothetical protein